MSVRQLCQTLCSRTLSLTHTLKSFSSILSSIGNSGQAAKPAAPVSTQAQPAKQPRPATAHANGTNGAALAPTNSVAGVKRRSEEPVPAPRSKAVKIENARKEPTKSADPVHPGHRSVPLSSASKSTLAQPARSMNTTTNAASPNAAASPLLASQPITAKRGFAATLAKAQAAQVAARAAGPSVYKHNAVSRIPSKRERERLKEEAKMRGKADRKRGGASGRSRSNTPVAIAKPGQKSSGISETGYKGTMKSSAPIGSEGLVYKGTMRSGGAAQKGTHTSKTPPGRRRNDEYVDWDEMDDIDEDDDDDERRDDERDYDSEGSSDMEGGFNDVEREEFMSSRAGRQEDLEAIAEEEQLKREKDERRRRLANLSKAAAGKKRY